MNNQSSNHLFMIEPEVFYSNEQTLDSNHYQVEHDNQLKKNDIKEKALTEFNNLKNQIEAHGIKVTSMKGTPECPDHIFPNWFITFEDKTFQLFSMKAENRRLEKTKEMIEFLSLHYSLNGDLTEYEDKGQFLEATSSMVFDRVNRVVYAAISPRTNADLTKKWCIDNNYELVMFETVVIKEIQFIILTYSCMLGSKLLVFALMLSSLNIEKWLEIKYLDIMMSMK